MKTVPTWRVILGSVVLTAGIVASYAMRTSGESTAEAAPAGAHGSGSAAPIRDAGMGSGSAMGSGSGAGSGAGSAALKPVKHAGDSPGPNDIPSGDTSKPTNPGPTGPIAPGSTPPTTPGTP